MLVTLSGMVILVRLDEEGKIPDAGDRIAINGVRNDQLASSGSITIGDSDFAATRGVCQVTQTGSIERQEQTGKECKKGLERFHVSATYSHWVLEATRNRKAGSRSGHDRTVIHEA